MSETAEQRINRLEDDLSRARREAEAWMLLAISRGEIIYCARSGYDRPVAQLANAEDAVASLGLCGVDLRYRPEVDMPWPLVPVKAEPTRG